MSTIPFSRTARAEAKTLRGTAPAELSTRRDAIAAQAGESEVPPVPARGAIVLVEPRTLIRECLARCLEAASRGETVHAFASATAFADAKVPCPAEPLILLGTADFGEAELERAVAVLAQATSSASIVLLADDMNPHHVLGALDKGARGYIPTSMPFDVAVKALHLVRAGGTFVPAESLRAPKDLGRPGASVAKPQPKDQFTARQCAVIEALRQGKANKVIAFELNMRESTVKVHVRNIMKKLKAKNRTEVAVRATAMAAGY